MKIFNVGCLSLLWVVFLCGETTAAESFCYEEASCGPDSDLWPGICKSGKVQSPISLTYDKFKHQQSKEKYELYQNEQYRSRQPFILKNNGHTVQASLQKDLTSTSNVEGTLLGGKYVFSQLHFHWGRYNDEGSEHTINGIQYPMEVHLVHYSNKYKNFSQALNALSSDYGAVAVIGRMFELNGYGSPALDPIVNAMTAVRSANTDTTANSLNVGSFLKQNKYGRMDCIQFYGSLTTPTCNEGVWWTILPEPLTISQKQLDTFRSVLNEEGRSLVNNYRPLQSIGARNFYNSQTYIG